MLGSYAWNSDSHSLQDRNLPLLPFFLIFTCVVILSPRLRGLEHVLAVVSDVVHQYDLAPLLYTQRHFVFGGWGYQSYITTRTVSDLTGYPILQIIFHINIITDPQPPSEPPTPSNAPLKCPKPIPFHPSAHLPLPSPYFTPSASPPPTPGINALKPPTHPLQQPPYLINLPAQIQQIPLQAAHLIEAPPALRPGDHLPDHKALLLQHDQPLPELALLLLQRRDGAATAGLRAWGVVVIELDRRESGGRGQGGGGEQPVRGGVLEDLGQGLERQHVQMQEGGRLRVDGGLQFALRGRGGGEVADAPRGDVVLREGVHEALADLGGVGELGGGGGAVGVSVLHGVS